uniref:beta-defensin 112 n=1 Tax=Urocitellus parryii TaxID=9999 RepID=UPI000E560EBE|nr:beta-defensin 112 [Urocitellus parryii]
MSDDGDILNNELPIGSQTPITTSKKLFTTLCRQNFQKLTSRRSDSFTISEKAQYRTDENKKAKDKKLPISFNWWEACRMIGGHCKSHCGQGQFRLSFCTRPTTLLCVTQCELTDSQIQRNQS